MNKNELIKLALPISIIIASTLTYLALTAKHRHCFDYWTEGKTDKASIHMAELQCHDS